MTEVASAAEEGDSGRRATARWVPPPPSEAILPCLTRQPQLDGYLPERKEAAVLPLRGVSSLTHTLPGRGWGGPSDLSAIRCLPVR